MAKTFLPVFSPKSVEDLLLAAIRAREENGQLVQVPLKRIFRAEFLRQLPPSLQGFTPAWLRVKLEHRPNV